jgi:hypothetical protein
MDPQVPRTPGPIDQQIVAAISVGFETVLKSFQAQSAELLSAMGDVRRAESVAGRVVHDVSVVEGRKEEDRPSRLESRAVVPDDATEETKPRKRPENLAEARSMSRSDIRTGLRNALAGRAEAWTMGGFGEDDEGRRYAGAERVMRPGVKVDSRGRYHENGKFIRAEDAFHTIKYPAGYHVDAQGRVRGPGGRFGKAAIASEGEEASLLRRQVMANNGMKVVNAWAEGDTTIGRALLSTLPEGAIKGVGTAAVAVAAGQKAWKEVQGQYAANRDFQEYYGGSNTAQFRERGAQLANRARGTFSLLGGKAYDDLFTQAMDQGMRGRARSDYINVGADLMGKGVSSSQVQSMMELNLKAGGAASGMRDLVDAISSVNAVAREAEVSAKAAREVFIQNYRASTQAIMGDGGTAIQQAQAFTDSQVAMGHSYMNRVDYSGTLNLNNEYANARRLGLTPAQYSVMQQTTSTLPGMVSQEDTTRQALNQTLRGSTGETMEQVVNRFVNSLGREFSPKDDTYQLGLALESAGFSKQQIQAVLRAYGISTDLAGAPGIAGNLFTTNAPSQVFAREQESVVSKLSGKPSRSLEKGKYLPDLMSLSTSLDVQPAWASALNEIYGEQVGTQLYTNGRTPSTTELELLQNIGQYGLDPDTQVVIKSGGQDRVVSLQEAIKNFPDQIENGSAKFFDGTQEGKTVADVMGFTGTSLTEKAAPSTVTGDPTVGTGLVEARRKQEEESSSSSSSGTTKVEIDLKPRVQEMFDLYVNSKYYDGGQVP